MTEFEVTCKVEKGERNIAYGEDCYCYYTQPNYNERIVRCRDCKKRLPKGYKFDKYCNEAEQDACNLFSDHDFDWDYTSFFM